MPPRHPFSGGCLHCPTHPVLYLHVLRRHIGRLTNSRLYTEHASLRGALALCLRYSGLSDDATTYSFGWLDKRHRPICPTLFEEAHFLPPLPTSLPRVYMPSLWSACACQRDGHLDGQESPAIVLQVVLHWRRTSICSGLCHQCTFLGVFVSQEMGYL